MGLSTMVPIRTSLSPQPWQGEGEASRGWEVEGADEAVGGRARELLGGNVGRRRKGLPSCGKATVAAGGTDEEECG